MVWVICGSIAGCLVLLLSRHFNGGNSKLPDDISTVSYWIILCTLFFVFAFLLLYKIDRIPLPFHVDEAGMAYDAVSLSKYYRDRYLYKFPVYFINYGGGQNALYTWLAALMIKIFNYSIISVRLPAIFLSLCSAVVFTFTIRSFSGNNQSIFAMIAYCFLPFSIMHSRWGLESYLLFPMLVIACCCFYHAVDKRKTFLFILSGVLFGVTFYSYAVSYVIVPLILGIAALYLLIIKKINWKELLLLAFPAVILAIPLLMMLAVNNGLMDEINTRYFSIPKLVFYRGSEFSVKNIVENLRFGESNIFYRIFVRDGLIYNVIPVFGSVYYFNIPIILYGFYLSAKRSINAVRAGQFTMDVMMFILFISVFPVLLFLPYANVNRACALFIPLIYFLIQGFCEILRESRTTALIYSGLFLLASLSFVCYYFADFPKDLSYELSITSVYDLEEALDFAEKQVPDDAPVIIYGLSNPYLYTILVKHIDPYTFNETKTMKGSNVESVGRYQFEVKDVSPDRVYLVRTDGWIPEKIRQQNFNIKEFGTVTVYYP